jgi:hypothetical protein
MYSVVAFYFIDSNNHWFNLPYLQKGLGKVTNNQEQHDHGKCHAQLVLLNILCSYVLVQQTNGLQDA